MKAEIPKGLTPLRKTGEMRDRLAESGGYTTEFCERFLEAQYDGQNHQALYVHKAWNATAARSVAHKPLALTRAEYALWFPVVFEDFSMIVL